MIRYFIFIAVSLALLLSSIANSSASVAFPVLTKEFGASIILAGWVLSVYQLVSTAAQPLTGKASDIFGRKLIFLVCLMSFIGGSVLCAVAPNIQVLILARGIQAVGYGGLIPSATGIVAEIFPYSKQRAVGLFISFQTTGSLIGPNLAGWMVSDFGWRSIFWFNVPLGIVIFLAAMFLVREGKKEKGVSLDLFGAGLFSGSLFALMTGLNQIGESQSWTYPSLLLAASAILLFLFVRHLGRVKNPIIDLEVLKGRPFMASNIYNFIFGAVIHGPIQLIPLFVTSVYGMTTLQSGLMMTPRSLGALAASTLASILIMRWGYRWPLLIGTIGMALAVFLLAAEPRGLNLMGFEISSAYLLAAIILMIGLSMGIANPAANNACIELMPTRVSTIVGVRGMLRNAGGAIWTTLSTLILSLIPDKAQAFLIIYLTFSITIFASNICVFMMPRSPRIVELEKVPRKAVSA